MEQRPLSLEYRTHDVTFVVLSLFVCEAFVDKYDRHRFCCCCYGFFPFYIL